MKHSKTAVFDAATIVRWLLYFIALIALLIAHLLITFRGLSSPQAMEQAQLGRQIARGEGFHTKMIRPLELHLAENHAEGTVPLTQLKDTYHSPLNPLVLGSVFKLIGADKAESWTMPNKQLVYPRDRVVALVSSLFFLMAIGVSYLLISRVFDGKIAGFTALLMLFCELFWRFAQSGMPQMLLLLLFTCGLYFAYRTIENQENGKPTFLSALLTAVFFSLMVLTHWITLWIFIGFLIYAIIAFRPRGLIAISSLGILLLAVAYPVIRMLNLTGEPLGVARFVFYNGLANGSESDVMRTIDLGSTPLILDGLLLKVFGTTLAQATNIMPLLGGILAAPIFFLALLHPFKSKAIGNFRWLIALMWLFAAVGMAIYGVNSSSNLHPNQIHLLFAPIMAAYGLAMLSILWSRLNITSHAPFLRNAHLWVVVVFSAAPMMLTLPKDVRMFMNVVDKGGWPQWPPYYPLVLNQGLANWVSNNEKSPEIVVSDQPWAVAWYADRYSLWLPRSFDDFTVLDEKATDQGTSFSGILITPYSHGDAPALNVAAANEDFAPLIFDGFVASITGSSKTGTGFSIYDKVGRVSNIHRRFPNRYPLLGQSMIYYSEGNLQDVQPSN